jgi:hypothetical protein
MLLAVLLSIQLSAPWRYIHDDNGAWTQAVASARLRAGFVATKGQDFYLARKDGSLVPYLHHPPLYGTTVAAVYWLTGRADPMTTRLVPAFFHLAGFVGMALLARRLFRRQTAKWTIALSVYALVPMSNYFGKMPFNEPVGLCCIVWALVCLARYRERPSRWTFAGTLAFWVLAGMTSWTAYVILFFVAALLIWEGRAGVRAAASSTRLGATLLLTGVAVGALVILHILWAGNWHLPTMFAAADTWGIHSIGPAGVVKRLAKAFDLHRIYFASVPLLLYLVGSCGDLTRTPTAAGRLARLFELGAPHSARHQHPCLRPVLVSPLRSAGGRRYHGGAVETVRTSSPIESRFRRDCVNRHTGFHGGPAALPLLEAGGLRDQNGGRDRRFALHFSLERLRRPSAARGHAPPEDTSRGTPPTPPPDT